MSCLFFAFLFAFESMLSTLLRNILTLPTLTSFGRGKLTSFGQDGPKWEGLTRNIELSNLDDFSDMSRQRLIWEGLEQIESIY
jgi:hypothetical protein